MYFAGFKVKMTGKMIRLYGRDWQEFTYLEGPKAGQTGHMPTKAEADRTAAQRSREWEEEQAGFQRLHETQTQGGTK